MAGFGTTKNGDERRFFGSAWKGSFSAGLKADTFRIKGFERNEKPRARSSLRCSCHLQFLIRDDPRPILLSEGLAGSTTISASHALA
jgi:hypothetical protein